MKTFRKDVDTSDRKAMIEFLETHFRYYTMNSWNRSTSYANNVKIYNLGIEDKDIEDKMYSLAYMDEDSAEVFFDVRVLISDFKRETGYDVGSNGRSGGYLVLYQTADDGRVYPGRDIDQYADFEDAEEWTMDALRERVDLVTKFDTLCDNILATYIEFCKNHKIETVTVTSISEKQIFVPIVPQED